MDLLQIIIELLKIMQEIIFPHKRKRYTPRIYNIHREYIISISDYQPYLLPKPRKKNLAQIIGYPVILLNSGEDKCRAY